MLFFSRKGRRKSIRNGRFRPICVDSR